MSEQAQASQANSSSAPAGPALQFDGRGAATAYANVFRACGTREEIILDFGLHDQFQAPSGPGNITVSQRLVLSYSTAQRLAALLHAVLHASQQNRRPAERVQRIQAPTPAAASPAQPPPAKGNAA
jgi:hypothetical protein